MEVRESLMFLPGASGNLQFWRPVSAKLRHPGARHFMAWPGFGGAPHEPGVRGIDDLLARVVREIGILVLLLWGAADPISPVAVGQRLAELFPSAELVIVEGGTHDLVLERAGEVAAHIERYLAT